MSVCIYIYYIYIYIYIYIYEPINIYIYISEVGGPPKVAIGPSRSDETHNRMLLNWGQN